jgi:predicted transcriptional regulator
MRPADSRSAQAAALVREGKATQPQAARLLGITRQSVSVYLKRHPRDAKSLREIGL